MLLESYNLNTFVLKPTFTFLFFKSSTYTPDGKCFTEHEKRQAPTGTENEKHFIPEIPYDEEKLAEFIKKKKQSSRSVVIAVAEGVMSVREAAMSKKERREYLSSFGSATAAERLTAVMTDKTGVQCRSTVLGHIQRGGEPCAYDKFISTEIGAFGAHLAKVGRYGVTVCIRNNKLGYNMLVDIAGKTKRVPADGQLVLLAKDMGIYFGD